MLRFIIGSLLLWSPLLAPFIFGIMSLASTGRIHFDFLIPAELFPLTLLGCLLLIWSTRSRKLAISAFIAFLCLLTSQSLALLTGLAEGRIPPTGLPWDITIIFLSIYDLTLLFTAIHSLINFLQPHHLGSN